MALYPAKDKELKRTIYEILSCATMQKAEMNSDCDLNCIECSQLLLIKYLEKRGYHVGLPESIEEALNSGDGTYRP